VQLHICELLLSYKANSELLNEKNETAFSISMQNKNFRMIDLLKMKLSFNRNPKLFIQFNSNIWREDYQKIIIQICDKDPPTKETMNTIVQDGHSPFTLFMQTAMSGQ
jgi:ankyrin repeat protein